MMKLILSLLATAALTIRCVDASTKIAVIEVGKGGVVRRTASTNNDATVEGVSSFWSALHSSSRKLQHADMTVVPDLFRKADRGLVIGLMGNGIDLDALPTINRLVSEEGSNGVVGHMEIEGAKCESLLSEVDSVEAIDAASFSASAKDYSSKVGLSAMKVYVGSSEAAAIDNQVAAFLLSLEHEPAAEKMVVHLVVEEEEGAARRRTLSRRLEGDNEDDKENEKDEDRDEEDNKDEDREENNENKDNNGNGNGNQQYNGYYGYGYYNAYGEWVTPYKTMFQIQYFNVVLWTSIGLTVVLFFTVYLMMNMPLMPDTLLFGESAKFVGDD